MKILIRSGEVIDPANCREAEILDLLLADGKIARIGTHLSAEDAKVIDAKGLTVTPGLIEMHTHFREPGQEHKETIRSGTRAAAKGGFTSAATMANFTLRPACERTGSSAKRSMTLSSRTCPENVVGNVDASKSVV